MGLLIGIDTGVNTGLGVWDKERRAIVEIATLSITKAMDRVREYASEGDIKLFIEDARLRSWFGNSGREKLQGAGSVKRDAKIWEDFCNEQAIPFELVAPRNNATKMSRAQFEIVTGWEQKTTEHSRDAMLLVFGR